MRWGYSTGGSFTGLLLVCRRVSATQDTDTYQNFIKVTSKKRVS